MAWLSVLMLLYRADPLSSTVKLDGVVTPFVPFTACGAAPSHEFGFGFPQAGGATSSTELEFGANGIACIAAKPAAATHNRSIAEFASRDIQAVADSGATGHVTWNPRWLVNTRACSDNFTAANGTKVSALCIGDLPVATRGRDGKVYSLVVRNVRCIPEFKFTLLSVGQLWDEHRIDSIFRDSRCVQLPGGSELPFEQKQRLPTLRMMSLAGVSAQASHRLAASGITAPSASSAPAVSSTRGVPRTISALAAAAVTVPRWIGERVSTASAHFYHRRDSHSRRRDLHALADSAEPTATDACAECEPTATDANAWYERRDAAAADAELAQPLASATAPGGTSSVPLGYHRIGTASHIARRSGSQAAEVLHRRCHAGINVIRALPFTTSDAPKCLGSATAVHACDHCAVGKIKKTSHSGTLSVTAS